ncbi:hypothetical protein GCM10010112_90920 [Actinoplanes lobatus]|uniref:Uncharacterized protein n=1 Tax=Actinoplanes lobatus TaxID=113568 RepID=A0A7W7HKA0_9ACTN|nr:hypothetical protein [Actinoplanes lobatus]MBB4752050.1 hypothetical protein [Actinoplanes lobatus]GGN98117.1 hypothetical protein GCM10010112_90920 [Actinoplanes lobatus]GIE45876.1 hypothetical protein Alo02nite_87740 [Actinoplanes lobatus]
MPLCAAVVTAAAGVGLTWESNPLTGERSGLSVILDHRATLPALIFLGALLMALADVVAAMAYHRRAYVWAAIVGALTALGNVGWYGIHIAGTRVHALGMDSAGNLIDPVAASRPGISWYLTATALLTTAVLAIGLTRRTRAVSRPGTSGAIQA